jgi:dynein heavy chain
MVFIDSEDLKWMEESKEYLLDLVTRYVEDGLKYVNKKLTQAMNQVCTIHQSMK